MSEPIAAIEIGTTRTVIAVGEMQPTTKRMRLLGLAAIPTTGVHKSQITDVSQAKSAVESALKQIQETARVSVSVANLVINGPQVNTSETTGIWQLDTNPRPVKDTDIKEVEEKAWNTALDELKAQSRASVQLFDLDYAVDDSAGILNPKGKSGQVLRHRLLSIHTSRSCMDDLRNSARDAKLEIDDHIFAGYAASIATVTEAEMRDGVAVIDLGGGSTSYAVFSEGNIVAAGVIGVGGDHVTNDIASAFGCSTKLAEQIKLTAASATIASDVGDKRIKIAGSATQNERSISLRALQTVVHVRMKELFKILRERLEESGYINDLGGGVVLTGGGASLANVAELASHTLGISTRMGTPTGLDGLEEAIAATRDYLEKEHPNAKTQFQTSPAAYATICGTLIYAGEGLLVNGGSGGIGGIFRRIFGK